MLGSGQLVNGMSIETVHGFRTVNLRAGDVTGCGDQLLVASSVRFRPDRLPEGAVVRRVHQRFGCDFTTCRPIVTAGHGVGTSSVEDEASRAPWRMLLVTLPGAERFWPHEPPDEVRALFVDGIWTLFGALAALELRGERFETMSMPTLGGAREFEPEFVITTILRHATDWLRTSRWMHTITVWVYDEDMVPAWTKAMDDALGRRVADREANQVARALADEILSMLGGSEFASPRSVAADSDRVCDELRRSTVSIQRVASVGRVLAETIVRQILEGSGLAWSGSFNDGIYTLRKREMVAPWIISHLHTLRVIGNESVHSQGTVRYRPRELDDGDLVPVLAALHRVVLFWRNWQSSG